MKKLLALLIGAASLLVTPAYADFTGKNAAAATVTFKNPNDCTSVVCVPIYAQYDATGANAVAVVTAGADGASNTANGALGYNRNLIFNGTTWDRWAGAVQGTGASGAALTGNPFRVGLSDGTNSQNWLAAIALTDGVNGNNTGATAAWLWNGATYDRQRGDLTNGAFVNVKTSVLPTGAGTAANQASQLTQETATAAALGTTADAVCGTATGTCTLAALVKFLNNAATAATPAGTNTIGNFGFDPSSGKGTPTSTFLALPATTTTQIVALSGSTKTYVTSYRVLAGGTVNVTFKTGTGSNCGTGTATLEGPWPLTAQAGMTVGSGTGPVLIAGAGLALCITTDASVGGGVALSYQQF